MEDETADSNSVKPTNGGEAADCIDIIRLPHHLEE